MPPTDRERRHFAAIRAAKEAEAEERRREASRELPMKRLIEGLALGEAAGTSPAIEAELDRRALGQGELQARARRLGLR